MKKVFSFIFNLLFRPDKISDTLYVDDPKYLDAELLIAEACNILDEGEETVFNFVAEQAHCDFNYDDWMRTGTIPPMMLQWLRNNIHHLRARIE